MDQPGADCPGNSEAFCRLPDYHWSGNHFWENAMRRPRDFDAELKALEDKAKDLKARKVQQLGELVIATGADTFSIEELAGALIVMAETIDAAKREVWAKRGQAFFRGKSRRSQKVPDRDTSGAQAQPSSAQPPSSCTGPA